MAERIGNDQHHGRPWDRQQHSGRGHKSQPVVERHVGPFPFDADQSIGARTVQARRNAGAKSQSNEQRQPRGDSHATSRPHARQPRRLRRRASARNAAPGPVVLELFTSQGCSSCPPADALLGKLAQRPEVIALAWHVDYWNHLGWRDQFASRQATERQQAYARQLEAEVFTPALVIDGATVVVGSDRAAVERAIGAATPLAVAVALNGHGRGRRRRSQTPCGRSAFSTTPSTRPMSASGENEGTRLREYRIVRQVDVLGEWDGAPRHFAVTPPGSGQGQVILVQTADLRIVGAADRPPASSGEAGLTQCVRLSTEPATAGHSVITSQPASSTTIQITGPRYILPGIRQRRRPEPPRCIIFIVSSATLEWFPWQGQPIKRMRQIFALNLRMNCNGGTLH